MTLRKTPPCNRCGKRVRFGNTNGIPNMVGLQANDGSIINICKDCLIALGKMNDDEKGRFFEELNIEVKNIEVKKRGRT